MASLRFRIRRHLSAIRTAPGALALILSAYA